MHLGTELVYKCNLLNNRKVIVNTEQTLHEFKQTCNAMIDLSESLERLLNNTDFKKVFNEHYLKNYTNSLVLSLSGFDKTGSEYQDILNKLHAVSEFSRYLEYVIEQGQWAKHSLSEASSIPEEE